MQCIFYGEMTEWLMV